jgi:hypothetical protein
MQNQNFLNKIDYYNLAGADWPTYEEYINNKDSIDFVNREIKKIKHIPLIPFVPNSPAYQQEKNPEISYQYTLNSMPRGKNSEPIENSCNRPFKMVEIDMFTNCNLCKCTGWLPKPVGKITEFNKLEDIWDNPKATEIQQNIVSKKFTWCAVDHCGIKIDNINEDYHQVIFAIDDNCNLECPSCRREKRMYTSGPLYEEKLKAIEHAVSLLNQFQKRLHVCFNASGDPLASPLSRPFLQSYIGNDLQTFTLFTNGLLIQKLLPYTTIFKRITEYRISVDAGSKEVYEEVRLGGKWEILLENFDFLKKNNLSNLVILCFVVQKKNYRDILNFENLCKNYGFYGMLTALDDWGTWISHEVLTPDKWTLQNGTWQDNNVLDKTHPEYQTCKDIIKKVSYLKIDYMLQKKLQ